MKIEQIESKPICLLAARCIQLFTGKKKGAKKRLLHGYLSHRY